MRAAEANPNHAAREKHGGRLIEMLDNNSAGTLDSPAPPTFLLNYSYACV